jgi:hypothetical protein
MCPPVKIHVRLLYDRIYGTTKWYVCMYGARLPMSLRLQQTRVDVFLDSFFSMTYTIRGIIASYLFVDIKNLSTWIIKRRVIQILYTSLFWTYKNAIKTFSIFRILVRCVMYKWNIAEIKNHRVILHKIRNLRYTVVSHGDWTSMCLLGERNQMVIRPIKETTVDSSTYSTRHSSEERRKKYICKLQLMVFCRINSCFV